MDAEIGQIVDGKYRIDRVLGRGGMGVVVAATHVDLHEQFALKFLHPENASNAERVSRFMREARAARQIRSEHVAQVSDVGRLDNGVPYLVMELLHGDDLSQVLAQRGPLEPLTAAFFIAQACDAIATAHDLGIIHRDIKPANLFLTRRPDGSPCIKVLDFGISKVPLGDTHDVALTKTWATMGSPRYMSPEQIREVRAVDARADVWALGVTLYELIAGHPPFLSAAVGELCAIILTTDPPPLTSEYDLPSALREIVTRCLQRDPDQRFANGQELGAALRACLAGSTNDPARMPALRATYRPIGYQVGPGHTTMAHSATQSAAPRSHSWVWGAAAGVLAVSGIAGTVVWQLGTSRPANGVSESTVQSNVGSPTWPSTNDAATSPTAPAPDAIPQLPSAPTTSVPTPVTEHSTTASSSAGVVTVSPPTSSDAGLRSGRPPKPTIVTVPATSGRPLTTTRSSHAAPTPSSNVAPVPRPTTNPLELDPL